MGSNTMVAVFAFLVGDCQVRCIEIILGLVTTFIEICERPLRSTQPDCPLVDGCKLCSDYQ